MRARRILRWTLLALAGLLVAVAVTTAATQLTSQRIGLESEPLDAGDALAPRRARATPTTTSEGSVEHDEQEAEQEDDGHGRGRGRGRGRGDDD